MVLHLRHVGGAIAAIGSSSSLADLAGHAGGPEQLIAQVAIDELVQVQQVLQQRPVIGKRRGDQLDQRFGIVGGDVRMVSADPSAADGGVWASVRPASRAATPSPARGGRASNSWLAAVDEGSQPALENAIDAVAVTSCRRFVRAWHPTRPRCEIKTRLAGGHMLVGLTGSTRRHPRRGAHSLRPRLTAYTGADNQELLTAALRALVARYRAAAASAWAM